jgi:hypothetical protein
MIITARTIAKTALLVWVVCQASFALNADSRYGRALIDPVAIDSIPGVGAR